MTDQLRKQTLLQAVRSGGAELLHHNPDGDDVIPKTSQANVLTSADLASQRAIVRVIQEYFPGDQIVSEEMDEETVRQLDPGVVASFTGWVADPLDGTNSFRFGERESCVSLAYIESGKQLMGAVLNPFTSELFYAERGHGAFLNDQPIHVAQTAGLSELTKIASSNCYDTAGTRANLERFLKLSPTPWVYIRGSVTLAMCEVACGRLDLFHSSGLRPWDNAAAFLILEESGAKVTDLKGKPITFLSEDVVVGNEALTAVFIAKTKR